MPKQKHTADNPGKVYRVTQAAQHFGRWSYPEAFNEHQFEATHKIPSTDEAREQVDADTYHDDLLLRATMIGAIEDAPDGTPVSPLNMPGATSRKNQAILASVTQNQQVAINKAANDQNDVASRHVEPTARRESVVSTVTTTAASAKPAAQSPAPGQQPAAPTVK